MRNSLFRTVLLATLIGVPAPHLTAKPDPSILPVSVRELKDIIRRDSGKIVLVNVWATWCKPCREEMPALLRLRKKFAGSGLDLLLVSADDPDSIQAAVAPLLKSFGADFTSYIAHDSTDEAFMSGMDSSWSGALPSTFLYDRRGNLVTILVGGKRESQFEQALKRILK